MVWLEAANRGCRSRSTGRRGTAAVASGLRLMSDDLKRGARVRQVSYTAVEMTVVIDQLLQGLDTSAREKVPSESPASPVASNG
jgi:hypothetical protein